MKTFYILILAACTIVITVGPAVSAEDHVLVLIPTEFCEQAMNITPFPITFHHRFAGFSLAGIERRALAVLTRAQMHVTILDDQPWTGSYAVVGNHPGKAGQRNYGRMIVRVLYASADFDIIKASPEVFEQLRKTGLACVEIERGEIPMETHSTHLPHSVFDRPNDFVSEIIASVSDTVIRDNIQALQNFGTRYWNNTNRDSVSRFLRARYLATGITDVVLDSFQYSSTWQTNVVATIPGSVLPAAELIVGGHHDSYSSNLNQAPGADDNASGTVVALEMARVLKLVNYQPSLTMRFMGFAAEEAGLRGSASYAQRARTANRDIRAMQNYDMVANRYQAPTDDSVYIVWYTTSEAYRDLHAAMMRMYTPLIPVSTTSYRSGSDSYSFWQQNYRTVFCIERNFSPFYHSPNDLLQYLDMGYCANIAKSGLAMLLTLDMMPPSVSGLQLLDCGNGTSLYARWDSVQVPDWYRYKVYVGTVPGVYSSDSLVTTRWKRLNGLTTATRYYIGVSIVDLAGREGIITEKSCTPLVTPLPPAGILAENISNAVRLTWRTNMEMDLRGYNLYRRHEPNPMFAVVNQQPITDTTYTDSLSLAGVYHYYLTAVDSTGNESTPSDTVQGSPIVGISGPTANTPGEFRLYQNFPNPFNPSTEVEYEIAEATRVELNIFDVLGRQMTTLVDEIQSPARYRVTWNAAQHASGVYYGVFKAGSFTRTMKMVLMR